MKSRKYIRFQAVAVAIGCIIMAIKFLAFKLTSSNAILSDALESIINVVAGSFALYSLILAAKPRDADHPYGHGKIEFISSGIEGTLILLAGVAIVWRSTFSLLEPHELQQLDLGLYLSAAAGFVNFGLGWMTERYGVSHNSPTMVASGKHLKTDGYTSLGLIIGLVAVMFTGMVWIDSAMAIVFGLLIALTGLKEIRRSVAGIMDEADFELLNELIREIDGKRVPNWVDLHNFRAQKFGKGIHVDCHLTLPYYLTIEQGHAEIERLESVVADRYPEGIEMFIHTDPCLESSCRICQKTDCPVRRRPMEERIEWQLDTVLKNRKHR